jgi:hypothetical protein
MNLKFAYNAKKSDLCLKKSEIIIISGMLMKGENTYGYRK